MEKSYKDIMNSQEEIRIRLTSYMAQQKLSLTDMAQKMGVASGTLIKFLSKGENIQFRPFCKMRDYLQKNTLFL